jgi:hypothetical protein
LRARGFGEEGEDGGRLGAQDALLPAREKGVDHEEQREAFVLGPFPSAAADGPQHLRTVGAGAGVVQDHAVRGPVRDALHVQENVLDVGVDGVRAREVAGAPLPGGGEGLAGKGASLG